MDFRDILSNTPVFLDGGMGTMLERAGLEAGRFPDTLNITSPEAVEKISRMYVEAGSQIVYANTFGANRIKLAPSGFKAAEVVSAGVDIAKRAAGDKALAALDIGPVGKLIYPLGELTFNEAYAAFAEMVKAGKKADLIAIETMSLLKEAKAAVLAAKENSSLPVICTMTFDKSHRTFTGTSVGAMCCTLEGLGVDAIGINCSLGPDELISIIEEMRSYTCLPIVAKPNAGLPKPDTGEYSCSPEDFSDAMAKLVKYGVSVFGGCCGTTPEYISKTVKKVSNSFAAGEFALLSPQYKEMSAVCSGSVVKELSMPLIIGERINPTGKKKLKEALKNGDSDYVLSQAVEQENAGADILDINTGVPGTDEAALLSSTVESVQSVTSLPLQIDSSDPTALEAALRVYDGKPIVNSVNGKEESLRSVLPLVKKYGAAVVGLTLDENGIPQTAHERFLIAEKIVSRAAEYGIELKNIYIDCLTLTVSTDRNNAAVTLDALRECREKLSVKTVLGVSNISFGLPSREHLNHTFLSLALESGLDLPIINPNQEVMSGTVRAFRVLSGADENQQSYINAYSDKNFSGNASEKTAEKPATLSGCIKKGLKKEAALLTAELLCNMQPFEIISSEIIPALDETGKLFEQNKIFLPQLLANASAAQAAFEVIKNTMPSQKGDNNNTIVIATVKNDVHDIGKNIVKIMLENYGNTVIDLGKDVAPELISQTVQQSGARLLGLSALMTTTLSSMAQTIALVKKSSPGCRIMVGGAVLTEDYALSIGADYYVKDAAASCEIAKKVFAE